MSGGLDLQLILALAIVALAAAVFYWHASSTLTRFKYLLTESRVPRRYLLLGLAAGLGVLYVTRR